MRKLTFLAFRLFRFELKGSKLVGFELKTRSKGPREGSGGLAFLSFSSCRRSTSSVTCSSCKLNHGRRVSRRARPREDVSTAVFRDSHRWFTLPLFPAIWPPLPFPLHRFIHSTEHAFLSSRDAIELFLRTKIARERDASSEGAVGESLSF